MDAETWAIVELMGHVKLAGKLSEEERFGSKMGRLDIPSGIPACSGVSASWCPLCGDCTCKDPLDKNDETCPLHAEASKHGDIQDERFVTQWFGGGSVYRITVVTETVARQVAKGTAHAPVSPWDFPKQLASPPLVKVDTYEGLPDDPDDDEDDERDSGFQGITPMLHISTAEARKAGLRVPRNRQNGSAKARSAQRGMNRLEERYACLLEMRRQCGDITWWAWESMKLRLADKTWYTPDFAVMTIDGWLEFHETKGFMRDDANVKLKIAAELYPFRFVLVRYKDKDWEFTEIKGKRQ